jgi:transcriptional regulator
MTQEQLAKKIKTTTCCVGNHEKSGITKIETLLKYCEALGCEPAELLSESFDPENYTLIAEITSFYPWNLACAVMGSKEKVYSVYVPALEEAITHLTDREQMVLEMRFEHGMTYEQCGYRFGVTRERIRQIEAKALRKLRHPRFAKHYLLDTLNKAFEIDAERARLERENNQLVARLNALGDKIAREKKTQERKVDIGEMELSVRSYNCLKRAGIYYVSDLEGMTYEKLKKVRNLGRKSILEVISKAADYGIMIPLEEGEV